jgi:hypothetical protein
MNIFTRLRKNLRDRLTPTRTYQVEMLVWYRLEERPIGSFTVTVSARTATGARNRAMQELCLKPDRCTVVKDNVNGHAHGRDH